MCCVSTGHFEPTLNFIFKAQSDLVALILSYGEKLHAFVFFKSPKQTNKTLQLGREKLPWLQTKLPSSTLAQEGFVKQTGGDTFFCFLLLSLQVGAGVTTMGFSGSFVVVNTDATFCEN